MKRERGGEKKAKEEKKGGCVILYVLYTQIRIKIKKNYDLPE